MPPSGLDKPPRISGQRIRPFSAPRHTGLKSLGLKNKASRKNLKEGRPQTGKKTLDEPLDDGEGVQMDSEEKK